MENNNFFSYCRYFLAVTTVKFGYQWSYHSREINLSMIVIFFWCFLFPICKYLGTLKSFVEKKYTHFGLHVDEDILWNFPCKANTSLPVLFLLFGKGIPWLNMSKSPMMPVDIMLLHLFNPFLFFFPSVFFVPHELETCQTPAAEPGN